MLQSVEIREIPYGSKEYKDSLELRNRVLRKPIGLNLFDENLDRDAGDCHIGAFVNDVLVGILILSPVTDDTVKMRQVGVDDSYRSLGIGRKMVEDSERYALAKGYSKITLHARETAVPFYQKLGYTVLGDTFTEVGIPHREMEKVLRLEQ